MSRLIYVHKSLNAKLADQVDWNPKWKAKNPLLTEDLATDGWPDFFEGLLERGIVDHITVAIESARGMGRKDIGNLECYVIPNLAVLYDMIKPGDIFFMRGAYKWWIPFVTELNRRKHWIVFYSAGTRRNFWPQWDVVLYEYSKKPQGARGKLYLPFNKPINNKLFQYEEKPMYYDLCIGASKIYDTKQQWRFVDAALAYRKKYNKDIKCVMPGVIRQSKETMRMVEVIKDNKLHVDMPGYVTRPHLAKLFNMSRIFGHHCTGQNDRGPLEAMATGVPLLTLRDSGYCYAPWMTQDHQCCRIATRPESSVKLAEDIHKWLPLAEGKALRQYIAKYTARNNDLEFTYEQFEKLFDHIKATGQPNRAKLIRAFTT